MIVVDHQSDPHAPGTSSTPGEPSEPTLMTDVIEQFTSAHTEAIRPVIARIDRATAESASRARRIAVTNGR